MEKIDPNFIRIGTQIYLISKDPSGVEKYIPWTINAILQDYGKTLGNEILSNMPKYVGWVNEPSHTDYKPVVGNWLNKYRPLPYQPQQGYDTPNIIRFLEHIFGEQFELGLDYLELLYLQPKQKLPILLLVSKERNTGKTTFLKFLKAIFGDNATFNTNESFKSQFNNDWASKLLIMVDEAFLEKVEYTERLKNLSTATEFKEEAKGRDRVECVFHGKFVLCSNNLDRPVIIDPDETRFWVRQIPRLKNDDTLMSDKLRYEIPAFLHFLSNRKLSTERRSRMWFSFDDYHTKALDRIVANNRYQLEQQLIDLFGDIMESFNTAEIEICVRDIYILLSAKGYQGRNYMDERSIRKVLKDNWKLAPSDNSRTYNAYFFAPSSQNGYLQEQKVGRFYTITKEFIRKLAY